MENVAMFFYLSGQDDERNRGNKPLISVSNNISAFYRLGVLSEKYKNCPTRIRLINELCREFSLCKHQDLPNLLDISLEGHYSHRLLKQIMEETGFFTAKPANCTNPWAIWRKKYFHLIQMDI